VVSNTFFTGVFSDSPTLAASGNENFPLAGYLRTASENQFPLAVGKDDYLWKSISTGGLVKRTDSRNIFSQAVFLIKPFIESFQMFPPFFQCSLQTLLYICMYIYICIYIYICVCVCILVNPIGSCQI